MIRCSVFENSELRRTIGRQCEEITEGKRKLYNKIFVICNLFFKVFYFQCNNFRQDDMKIAGRRGKFIMYK